MRTLAKILAGSALLISTGLAANTQRIMDWAHGYEAPEKHRRDLGPMPAFEELEEVSTPDEYRAFTTQRCAVVEYSASWCIPCRTLKPDLAQIAREQRDIPFGSVDIDTIGIPVPQLGGVKYWTSVEGIKPPLPQIVFYSDGKPIAQTTGYAKADRPQLEASIAEFSQQCGQTR